VASSSFYHLREELAEDPEMGEKIHFEDPSDFPCVVTQEGVTGKDPSIVDENGHVPDLSPYL
jgi:hypothetical protein